MIKSIVLILTAVLSIGFIYGQVTGEVFTLSPNLLSTDYLYSNNSNLEHYHRVKTRINLPPLHSKNWMVIPSIAADQHFFSTQELNDYPYAKINNITSLTANVLVRYSIQSSVSINALVLPFLTSRTNATLYSEDITPNGMLFIEKEYKTNENRFLRLSFGVGYLTLSGTTTISPIVNLSGKFNPSLSFVLGLPNSYLHYQANAKHGFKLFGELNDFIAKLNSPQNSIGYSVDQFVNTAVLCGIEYEYKSSKGLGIYLRGAHSLYDNTSFNDSDNEVSFTLNESTQLYVSAGLRLQLPTRP